MFLSKFFLLFFWYCRMGFRSWDSSKNEQHFSSNQYVWNCM